MLKAKLCPYLYALPQPFVLILLWHILFNHGFFDSLALDLRWAVQLILMLFSLFVPLYLGYKAAGIWSARRFWLLFALGLPLSLGLVRIWEQLLGAGMASFGGMNELLPAGQLVQTLWLLLLLGQGVVWVSVKK